MVYDKKRPRFVGYPLFGLLLCFTLYINLCIYKKKFGSCCFAVAVGSASDRSSVECSAIF